MPNTSIQADGGAMPATETPQLEIRRLSWRIADLLNDLGPRIEYVAIRASNTGTGAVMTGFEVPLGDETAAEHLFREWQTLRMSILGEDTPEVEKRKLQRCEQLRNQSCEIHPLTVRDLVLMIYIQTTAGVDDYDDAFMTNVFSLAGLQNENVPEGV